MNTLVEAIYRASTPEHCLIENCGACWQRSIDLAHELAARVSDEGLTP